MPVKMPSSKKQVQEQQEVVVEQQNLTQEQPQTLEPEQLLVNEYVKCAMEVEPVKEYIKQMEVCRKSMQSIAAQHPAQQPVILEGTNGMSVTFKAAGDKRVVKDMNGLIGVLKTKVSYTDLMGMLSISMTDLDKILSPLEQEPYIEKVEGSRTMAGYTGPKE